MKRDIIEDALVKNIIWRRNTTSNMTKSIVSAVVIFSEKIVRLKLNK